MSNALSLLLDSAVDDLGLISRPGVDLAEGLKAAISTSSLSSPRLLRNFAVPSAVLSELPAALPAADTESIRISVFGDEQGQDWQAQRVQDATRMNHAQTLLGDCLELNTYLVKPALGSPIESVYESLRGFSAVNVQVLLGDLEDLGDAIAQAADREWISLAFDISKHQTNDSLIRFILECSGLEVPYQIMGLSGRLLTNGTQIGVLNVLTAGSLAFSADLSARELGRVLECADLARWKTNSFDEHPLGVDEVEDARDVFWGVGVDDLPEFSRDLARRQGLFES